MSEPEKNPSPEMFGATPFNPTIDLDADAKVEEVSEADARENAKQALADANARVNAARAELEEASAELSECIKGAAKLQRTYTLAECNASQKEISQRIAKDHNAAQNYANSRGLVLQRPPVSSPAPRLTKIEGK